MVQQKHAMETFHFFCALKVFEGWQGYSNSSDGLDLTDLCVSVLRPCLHEQIRLPPFLIKKVTYLLKTQSFQY